MSIVVRAAKTSDVKGIRKLIDTYPQNPKTPEVEIQERKFGKQAEFGQKRKRTARRVVGHEELGAPRGTEKVSLNGFKARIPAPRSQ